MRQARDREREKEIRVTFGIENYLLLLLHTTVIVSGSSCLTESLPVSATRLIVTICNLKLT